MNSIKVRAVRFICDVRYSRYNQYSQCAVLYSSCPPLNNESEANYHLDDYPPIHYRCTPCLQAKNETTDRDLDLDL